MTKVLVIEDEAPVRANIVRLLKMEEFEAIAADDGAKGVQVAREEKPDLILCDVMMPQLNGHEVLSQLRQYPETRSIPFIFLTAKVSKADLRQGMELGADDYITKPFTQTELLQAIKTRLEKQESVKNDSKKKLEELGRNITLALPQELQTPLTQIAGLADVLIDESESLSPREIVEIGEDIKTSARRLYRLTQNFLIIANLEILAQSPERIEKLRNQQFSLPGTLIANVARQKAREVGREEDLTLELQDATVRMSELKLKKIVEDLIDNAFKFSQPGSPVLVESALEKNNFVVYVTDRGRGMTAEQIASLGAYMQFERQVYEQQGSGLGLAIAKRLAELHGGKLAIESIPGVQTTVLFSLPL